MGLLNVHCVLVIYNSVLKKSIRKEKWPCNHSVKINFPICLDREPTIKTFNSIHYTIQVNQENSIVENGNSYIFPETQQVMVCKFFIPSKQPEDKILSRSYLNKDNFKITPRILRNNMWASGFYSKARVQSST